MTDAADAPEESDVSYHLEVSKVIRASRAAVFAAWTDPEQIVQWWGAGGVTCTDAELDVVPGGHYRIANLTPDGHTMWISGSFAIVEPPTRLVYTWAVEPHDDPDGFSRVEVRFDELAEGTMVTVSQTLISTLEGRDMNRFGWIGCLDGLEELLSR